MMDGNKYFLDTNIIVEFLRGNQLVINFLKQNTNYIVPAIVYGELIFGMENAKQFEKHTKQLQDFITNVQIIPIDSDTSKYYGKIKSQLRKSGKPIPDKDIWIASLSMQHNYTLITNDAHFTNVSLLKFKQI